MTTTNTTGPPARNTAVSTAVAAALAAPLPDITPADSFPSEGLVLGAFLRPHLHGLHPYLIECELNATIDALQVLPLQSTVLRWHKRDTTTEVLAASGDCLVVVEAWKRAGRVWVSGTSRAAVDEIATAVKAKLPPKPVSKAIRVTFWHAGKSIKSRSNDLDVPAWNDVAAHYPSATRAALAQLVAHRPTANTGGRLVLWHGPPGTGKTTAVRALFDAWRSWTSAHVVSDPEQLLNNADYLSQVILDADEDSVDRWRLVVIEDAEELLRRDARSQVGTALGRLLNAADGLLGQGLRVLMLLTTNEQVDEMHPALLRPGRCLAKIEFPAFSAAEAGKLLGENLTRELTLAEIMERRGELSRVQMPTQEVRPGLYL